VLFRLLMKAVHVEAENVVSEEEAGTETDDDDRDEGDDEYNEDDRDEEDYDDYPEVIHTILSTYIHQSSSYFVLNPCCCQSQISITIAPTNYLRSLSLSP